MGRAFDISRRALLGAIGMACPISKAAAAAPSFTELDVMEQFGTYDFSVNWGPNFLSGLPAGCRPWETEA
jgi:hypothetical protein